MSQRQRDFWSFSFTFTFSSVGFCPSSFFALLERLRVDVFFFRVEAAFFSRFPAERDVRWSASVRAVSLQLSAPPCLSASAL